jgi:acetamidase/formamidase
MFTGSAASQQGTTVHRYVPDRYFNTFSFAHPPVLRIRPGDRVITSTIDAFGNDSEGRLVGARGNPQTGPFFVEGAEPGDMLVVMFHRIEPNRATAVSNTLLAAYALDPAFLRARGEREQRVDTWAIDKVRGVARTTSTDLIPGAIEVPLSPMLGCVATAPANKEAIRTTTPGPFGGNMDYIGVKPGATVMLPVNEPGALLFIGDGHAAQGHAELVGTGLETSMDVEFSVQLVKGKTIAWPRIEDERYLMVAGSERPLLQAFQHATTEMLSWLMTDYGYNERTASALLGVAAEYEIANVVDPHFTVVAKLPKANLPRR